MAEIAEIIGVTRQRVAQLIETYEDFPKPEVELSGGRVWSRTAVETWVLSHPERTPGRPEAEHERRHGLLGRKSSRMFDRFTDRARSSIAKAQEEARLLNHNYIGTEHLLLGLIALQDGVAWRVLNSLGLSLTAVRVQIEEMIGRGPSTPEGSIPFTPRSKKVLELALREALQLGHNYVGTEHVLLALVREHEGVGWQALEKLGLRRKTTRAAILQALQGFRPYAAGGRHSVAKPGLVRAPEEAVANEFLLCSFCGKAQSDVEKLIAGPGVYICNECVALCEEIIEEEKAKTQPSQDLVDRLERLEKLVADLRPEDEGD